MVEPLYKFMMKTKLIVMLGLLFALPAVLKAEAQLQKISVDLEDVSDKGIEASDRCEFFVQCR